MTDDGRTVVLSYGGGRQTAALCVAVCEGKLPRPDRIVMADTGRESSATWDYLRGVMTPYLGRHGLAVEVAPHSLATVDLYGHNGDLLIPAWTRASKLQAYCSGEWKRDVNKRYLRAAGVKKCVQWLGYSVDELRRVHRSRLHWVEHQFPLIDVLRWTAADCVRAVLAAGLPEPPKSACYICPHWKPHQWREMRDNRPDDFEKACELDEQIRANDREQGVYLYSGRVPLALADLDADCDEGPNLFRACESGHCWT